MAKLGLKTVKISDYFEAGGKLHAKGEADSMYEGALLLMYSENEIIDQVNHKGREIFIAKDEKSGKK